MCTYFYRNTKRKRKKLKILFNLSTVHIYKGCFCFFITDSGPFLLALIQLYSVWLVFLFSCAFRVTTVNTLFLSKQKP